MLAIQAIELLRDAVTRLDQPKEMMHKKKNFKANSEKQQANTVQRKLNSPVSSPLTLSSLWYFPVFPAGKQTLHIRLTSL